MCIRDRLGDIASVRSFRSMASMLQPQQTGRTYRATKARSASSHSNRQQWIAPATTCANQWLESNDWHFRASSSASATVHFGEKFVGSSHIVYSRRISPRAAWAGAYAAFAFMLFRNVSSTGLVAVGVI